MVIVVWVVMVKQETLSKRPKKKGLKPTLTA
jgi:hypothetical protein